MEGPAVTISCGRTATHDPRLRRRRGADSRGPCLYGARRPRRRPASAAFAAALACAGARELAAPAGATELSVAACVLALAGTVALVVERYGWPDRLSWLDAAIGASSVGALAVSMGTPPAAAVAGAGVAAGLGLSRWRVSPVLLCALSGLALLGVGGALSALAAVPLFLAAFLHEPSAGPGPEF